MNEIIIRHFRPEDRQALRDIAWESAFMGKSGDQFFESKEILADFLTMYFTDHEPQSCFVAETGEGLLVGYLTGALDSHVLDRVALRSLAWRILFKSFRQGVFFKKKNLIFISRCILSFFRGEFSLTDFSKKYPAVLHINIKEAFRRLSIGSRLMTAYLEYLKQNHVSGVHLATMSDHGRAFFESQGFVVLYAGKRSYFRPQIHQDIPVSVLGKVLT